jgi:hypothetical protein
VRFDIGPGLDASGGGDLRSMRDEPSAVRVLAIAQHLAVVIFDVYVVLTHGVPPILEADNRDNTRWGSVIPGGSQAILTHGVQYSL